MPASRSETHLNVQPTVNTLAVNTLWTVIYQTHRLGLRPRPATLCTCGGQSENPPFGVRPHSSKHCHLSQHSPSATCAFTCRLLQTAPQSPCLASTLTVTVTPPSLLTKYVPDALIEQGFGLSTRYPSSPSCAGSLYHTPRQPRNIVHPEQRDTETRAASVSTPNQKS